MVQLENVGYIITITFIVTGLFMTAVADAQPEEFSGLAPNKEATRAGIDAIEQLSVELNQDLNTTEGRSEEYSQSTIGINSLFISALEFGEPLFVALTSWMNVLFVIFGFTTDPSILMFRDALITLVGIIMAYSIFRFIGTLIKSLPFL